MIKDWFCSQPGCGLWHSEHNMKIDNFRGRNGVYSNFWLTPIVFEGDVYRSLEHAYQAAKTPNPFEREQIMKMLKPGEAKRAGKKIAIRPDWEKVKVGIMHDLVLQKFSAEPFRSQLLGTEDAELIEGNTWHDNFWGACTCTKCVDTPKINQLGKILMRVRAEIANVSINN